MKPSAGPWKVGFDSISHSTIIRAADHTVIAAVWGYAHHDARERYQRANARLMAAAPELLAALQRMERAFRKAPTDDMDVEEEIDALSEARAALTRAGSKP